MAFAFCQRSQATSTVIPLLFAIFVHVASGDGNGKTSGQEGSRITSKYIFLRLVQRRLIVCDTG